MERMRRFAAKLKESAIWALRHPWLSGGISLIALALWRFGYEVVADLIITPIGDELRREFGPRLPAAVQVISTHLATIALLVLFGVLVFVAGRRSIAPATAKVRPSEPPLDVWDWNLEQMSAYLRSRGIGGDRDYDVCNMVRDHLRHARLHIEGRQGDPHDEKTWSEHVVIRPEDWRLTVFDQTSFDLAPRFWRTQSGGNGIPVFTDMRVRSAQVLKEWPPGVGQSVAETIQPRPRVWVRHLESKPPAHYSEPGKERCYRHRWEVKIRSIFGPPPLRLAVRGEGVLSLDPDLPEYSLDDENPFEISVTNPPPLFTFLVETTGDVTPHVDCEFVT
jgi:hypothetical protein